MTKIYDEHKISEYIYTPRAGSSKHRTPCGHILHFAPNTRIVVMCDDCVKHLKALSKVDDRCVKATPEGRIKAKKQARKDEHIEKRKTTARKMMGRPRKEA